MAFPLPVSFPRDQLGRFPLNHMEFSWGLQEGYVLCNYIRSKTASSIISTVVSYRLFLGTVPEDGGSLSAWRPLCTDHNTLVVVVLPSGM